jgi:hypothetical protein
MFSNYFFHKEKAQKQIKETQIFTMEKKLRYMCFTQTTGVGAIQVQAKEVYSILGMGRISSNDAKHLSF